jgi:phosphatidylinositol-3-phosphatase
MGATARVGTQEVVVLRRSQTLMSFALLLSFLLAAPARAGQTGLEGVPGFSHVFLIIGENTTYSQLAANNAPYQETQLRPDAAWFTNDFAISHYSTSNYVAMTSGQYTRCEQEDVKPIDCHQDTTNIFNQLSDAGISWTEWNESMPSPCYLLNAGSDKTGNAYRPKHSPAEYYTGVVGDYSNPSSLCTDNVIAAGTTSPNDMSAFNGALRDHTASAFNYVVPNMCEDGHDNCKPAGNAITQFDDFLAREVPLIRATYPDALVIVTYDEAQGGGANYGSKFGGGNVLLAMVGPQVTPGQYDDLQSHYGLLRTLEDGFGIGTYANNAATADPITNIWP